MKSILDGKTVRFIAVEKKYARQPYPLIAPMSENMNAYVTGQHIVPGDPETQGNLTTDEMTGKKKLTTQKANRFQFVINPDNPTQIFHMRAYDCTLDPKGSPINPKDYFQANFIFLQTWICAPSKDMVKPGKHQFYLNDKEQEAKARVFKADERYEAEKAIREECAIEDYKIMVYMFNMRIPGFYSEPGSLNDTQLKDVLLQQAEKNPKEVMYFFSDAAQPILLGARLYGEKILTKRHDGYYYDGQFLAIGTNELARYLSDEGNVNIVDKLKNLLKQKRS